MGHTGKSNLKMRKTKFYTDNQNLELVNGIYVIKLDFLRG